MDHCLAVLLVAVLIAVGAEAAYPSAATVEAPGLPSVEFAIDIAGDRSQWRLTGQTRAGARYRSDAHSLDLTIQRKGSQRVLRLKVARLDGKPISVDSYAAELRIPKAGLYAVMVPNTRPIGRQLDYYHQHRKWREDVTVYRCRIPEAFQEKAQVNNEAPMILLSDEGGYNKLCVGWAAADVGATLTGADDGDCYKLTLARREDQPFNGSALEDALIIDTSQKPWMSVETAYAKAFDAYNARRHSKPPNWAYDPVFCTWYCYSEHIDHDLMLRIGAKCKELGITTFLIDAGWDKKPDTWWGDLEKGALGDYAASPELFPDLPGLVDQLRAMGLRVQLWASPFWQGKGSRIYQEKSKDWMVWDEKGEGQFLCPKHPEVRKMLRERFAWIAKTYGIDGMWLDVCDGVPPKCLAKHEHLDQTMGDAFVDCMVAIREGLRSIRPDAVVEARILHANLNVKPGLDVVQCGDSPHSYEMIRLASIHLRPWAYDIVVKNDPMIWYPEADDATVGKFMATMLCNGVPALSVDFLKASQQQCRITRAWLDFHREHRRTFAKGEFRLFGADCGKPDMLLMGEDEAVVYLCNPKTDRLDLGRGVSRLILLNCTDSDAVKLRIAPASGRWSVQAYKPDWSEAGIPTQPSADGELSLSCFAPQGGAAVVLSEARRAIR